MKKILIFIVLMMFIAVNISAFDEYDFDRITYAQSEGDQLKGEPRRRINQEEMHKRFEQLKLIKLLELLNLDEENEAKFISLYRKHHKDMKELMKTRDDLLRDLRKLVGSQSDDKKSYEELFEKLNNIEIKRIELTHSYFNKVKSVLTHEQMGKMYIFHARFGPELMGKIREFRQQHGPGGPGKKRYPPYDEF